jgi:hypothetical protein
MLQVDMKKGKVSIIILAVGIIFVIAIGTIMAKTPQQPYKEIRTIGALEIRFYPQAVMASVQSSQSGYEESSKANFRKLAGYIFGDNQQQSRIAMTAPVHMDWNKQGSSMSFVMPEGYNLQNLPKPKASDIQLHTSEEEYVAVLRFGGYASDKVIAEKKAELEALLKKAGIRHHGNFRYLGYNAPWDFINRRNEVVVRISREDAVR